MVSASEALLDVLEEHPAVVSVRAAVHPSANNFFRLFFIVIFSILSSYFDICFGWQMYQSALPEQSKECVWKEDSLWFGAARRDERFY